MPTPADKIMFEIYREAEYDRQFRVVYFTELDEHNKEKEIGRAMAGEHFYDGFIRELRKEPGKQKIDEIIRRLNEGESLSVADVERELSELDVLSG